MWWVGIILLVFLMMSVIVCGSVCVCMVIELFEGRLCMIVLMMRFVISCGSSVDDLSMGVDVLFIFIEMFW